MANPTVAAGFPKAFIDFAVSRGTNGKTLLERARIRPDDLDEQDDRIPLANYTALLKAGIELCGEPALALLFGEAVKMPDISIVGLIGANAESAEAGRRQMNRYAPLMLDENDGETSERITFVRENGNVWLNFTSPIYVENPLITESGFARAVCGARAMLKEKGISTNQSFPKAIHFTHDEPSYSSEYDRIFRVPLFFGSHTNAFLMDADFLNFTPQRTNPYLARILNAHAEELLKKLESSKSVRRRVENMLMSGLHTGEANVNTIARKLGLSRQTLFRKLKAEGVTFAKVLDELRHKAALYYLNERKISVNETAYLLGFSEPPAFSRAFKRWTGSSPRLIRASSADNSETDLQ